MLREKRRDRNKKGTAAFFDKLGWAKKIKIRGNERPKEEPSRAEIVRRLKA